MSTMEPDETPPIDLDRTVIRVAGRDYTVTELLKVAACVLVAVLFWVVSVKTGVTPWRIGSLVAAGYAAYILFAAPPAP